MRLAQFGFIAALIVLLTSCSQDNEEWKKISPAGGNFSIDMPSPIKQYDKTEETVFGKQVAHHIEWKPSSFAIDKFKLFSVTYTDCPSGISSDSLRLNAILDSAIMMRKKDFTEAESIESQNIELNGYPGRAFFYDAPKATSIVTEKMCIVNGKLYDLTVISKKNYSTNKEINTFFNSFLVMR